jgi:hypothetical protein
MLFIFLTVKSTKWFSWYEIHPCNCDCKLSITLQQTFISGCNIIPLHATTQHDYFQKSTATRALQHRCNLCGSVAHLLRYHDTCALCTQWINTHVVMDYGGYAASSSVFFSVKYHDHYEHVVQEKSAGLGWEIDWWITV